MPGKQLEELQKFYVESEIINYNYHKHLYIKYKAEIERLTRQIKVGPSSSTSSVIAMPEENNHSQEANNLLLARCIDELEGKVALEQKSIDNVDVWISSCCKNEKQEKMIRLYMIEYQCSNSDIVAKETEFSEVNVRKIKERLINRIISKYF